MNSGTRRKRAGGMVPSRTVAVAGDDTDNDEADMGRRAKKKSG